MVRIENPFRPGAGHMPPYLAGRTKEQDLFTKQLQQSPIIENMILTGLRGVGKTVLLETLKPIAQTNGWIWAGADMSESAAITEDRLATRLLTDLALQTSSRLTHTETKSPIGFGQDAKTTRSPVGYNYLFDMYKNAPGLVSDKLKFVLSQVWPALKGSSQGIVFAYDEAQVLSDKAASKEYPLSMLLEVFQSLQKQGYPFLLVLTGLPTLFPKLVAARTYSERMFHVVFLSKLTEHESKEAIVNPTKSSTMRFSEHTVDAIVKLSGGYPYFLQFICREVFDVWINKIEQDQEPSVPEQEIVRKLDNDFFAARWDRATDRERDLLSIISTLENCDDEFSVSDVVQKSEESELRKFTPSNANQMLSRLIDKGLIFKNRHGKYSFAVPLLGGFIRRNQEVT